MHAHPELLKAESDLYVLLDVEDLELVLTHTHFRHHHPTWLCHTEMDQKISLPVTTSLHSTSLSMRRARETAADC